MLLNLQVTNSYSCSDRYSWTLTFTRVNKYTDYGYVYDPNPGSLGPLTAQSLLKGTSQRVWIGYKSGKVLRTSCPKAVCTGSEPAVPAALSLQD